jgi:threonine dehydrogenase-like Zn-dependent dehydrogenase
MAYVVELTEARVVGLRDYPTPDPGAGEVRVRTIYSGISAGTELTFYRGTNPYLDKKWDPRTALFLPGSRFLSGSPTFTYPVDAWGYSEVGVVDATGDGVVEPHVGDVVWGIWGHRSHAVLPASKLIGHTMPAGLDPVVGTFDRVGAVALNAVLASGVCAGESVAVFGLGVIGLLATQLLISQGAEVLAIDTLSHRLDLAAKFGAIPFPPSDGDLALAVREHTGGRGADRVIELTGAYPALHQAIRLAGVGGTVIAAGFYQGPATELALGEEFHHNQVTLISSQIGNVPLGLRNRWNRDRLHETVMRLCANGRLDPMPLISRVIPATQAAEAYQLLDSPPADLMQVILSFDPAARGDQEGSSPLLEIQTG